MPVLLKTPSGFPDAWLHQVKLGCQRVQLGSVFPRVPARGADGGNLRFQLRFFVFERGKARPALVQCGDNFGELSFDGYELCALRGRNGIFKFHG